MRRSLFCFLALATACGQDVLPTEPAILTRPTAITFACVGDTVLEAGTANERIVATAQPVELCRQWLENEEDEPPTGQDTVSGSQNRPTLVALVTQSASGSTAVLRTSPANVIVDTDPLAPGKNAIPIGTLPVASVADDSGCFMVTANAGTCDLSTLDITSAESNLVSPLIGRIPVTNASGEVVDAKPAAMTVSPQSLEFGNECPATPTGTAYIAYPDCNLVAAVDLATGVIQGGLRFRDDGTAVVVDGNVQCRSQCGGGNAGPDPLPDAGVPDASTVDAGTTDAGPPEPMPEPISDGTARPSSIHYDTVNDQLIIGADNSNSVVVATLSAEGVPTASRAITVEGDVGITNVTASEIVQMGGNTGNPGGTAGDFVFIYAIATDRTIRVIDLDGGVECDTQVDPRFIRDETNVSFLACMEVGGVDTPPRRAGARGPGISTPRDSTPLDVAIVDVLRGAGTAIQPEDMAGTFAFITMSDGFVLVANIDDDVYDDLEDNVDPESTYINLAIAHQLRDFVSRDPTAGQGLARDVLRRACALPDDADNVLPPRLAGGALTFPLNSQIDPTKRYELPGFRSIECNVRDEENEITDTVFISQLAFAAPVLDREQTFPDLHAVRNETWSIAWQGPLSRDSGNQNLDGPPIRSGQIVVEGGNTSIVDPAAPFCDAGVEPFDIVQFAGCNPADGDIDCGLGEECFVHPEAPESLTFGTCLPSDLTDILAVQCRDYLIGNKTYSVVETNADNLVLRPRRRQLDTTPLDGCSSNTQCEELFELDRLLTTDLHPIQAGLLPTPTRDFDWVCAPDPSRKTTVDTCQMACTEASDCEAGFACDDGFCVAGPLPPRQCTLTQQRFQVNGGETFVVIGSSTGYIHNRIIDENTGACIDDPNGHPLQVGRIPLRAPACTGEGLTDLTPNPCSIEVEQQELVADFEVSGDTCELSSNEGVRRDRTVTAVRFRNPVFQFDLIDMETTGDAQCRNDRQGTLPSYSATHNGLELGFELTGGFVPMFVRGSTGGSLNIRLPVEIAPAFDGSLWILDQGDSSGAIQGRVVVMDPANAPSQFATSTFDNLTL